MPVTLNSVVQVLIFVILVFLITKPMGLYMTRIFAGERTWLSPVLVPVEKFFYRVSGVNADEEHKWTRYVIDMLVFSVVSALKTRYVIDMLVFSVVSALFTYLIERNQAWLPLNPQHLPNVEPQLAFNTAISFTTNTNWQNYVPEQTMSYFTQMVGLVLHNFASAATGIALAVAVIRGLTRRSAQNLGNFYVDFTRCILYLLLPFSIVGALFYVSQGM